MVRPALLAAVLILLLALPRPGVAAVDAEGRTLHTVYPGQTLGKIAKRYRVTVEALCRTNGLRRGAPIREGQRLIIPDGHEEARAAAARPAGRRWQDYSSSPRRRGYVVLESPTKRWRGFVLTKRGKVMPRAKESIERLLASWRTGTRHEIDGRLIQLVVKTSDAFGGRPIRVVSGYRERSFAVESKHKVGRAFDFSIPGVPNALLKDYLRTLPDVGVGYYPNSTHVHLDVRDQNVFWVDDSSPGAPPDYVQGGSRKVAAPGAGSLFPGEDEREPEAPAESSAASVTPPPPVTP